MFNKDNIIDARFARPSQDLIAVVYTDEAGQNVETYVEVNDDDHAYKSLVELGYSKEVIVDKTAKYKQEYMRNVYNTLRDKHADQHEKVLKHLELEKQVKRDEINALDEILELKRQQFLIATAAIEAIKEINNIKAL